MDNQTLRSLVRDVLKEVLAAEAPRLKRRFSGISENTPNAPVEQVRIASDADLATFVKKIAALCQDENTRRDLASGKIQFGLAGAPSSAQKAAAPFTNKGLVSERQVDALAAGTTVIQVAKGVRFTPLAQDRLRQKGIKVERICS